jgi:hypothetical protein
VLAADETAARRLDRCHCRTYCNVAEVIAGFVRGG